MLARKYPLPARVAGRGAIRGRGAVFVPPFTGHKSAAMRDRYDHPELADRITALEPAREIVEGLLG
jgi:hypothetical protein